MHTRYPEFTATGAPRALGREIGEQLGEQIRGFCEIALAQVNRTMKVSRANALKVVHESIGLADDYAPDMMAELRGMAEAARVSLDDLMLLQVRNQLKADDAGCTSLALRGERSGLVAQNWDNDPLLDPFTVVLTRRPKGKPALTTVTQAGSDRLYRIQRRRDRTVSQHAPCSEPHARRAALLHGARHL